MSSSADQTTTKQGSAKSSPWSGILKPVFIPASVIIVAMIALAAIAASDSERIFGTLNTWITEGVGWWYILIVTVFVVFALYCGFSSIGSIRLGKDDERPEFSTIAWFAMLFSAGMGIGLVFWGVAEPLSHLVSPPSIDGQQAEGIAAANDAMNFTMFHWGLHAWAIYVVVGLGLAFMTYRRGRPLSIRWLLEPLLGRARVEGPIGHAIDAMAIVGTLFGVATSLGLGIQQIIAGLTSLGWVAGTSDLLIIAMIVVITGIATLSVASGVDKGLKWLSNINMGLAAALLLFVLLAGPTLLLLQSWVGNLGGYIAVLPDNALRMAPLDGLEPINDTWLNSWTIFYWGWWMSWAPFVGMFIARISRGRTIRQFVFGVLLAPTLVASIWFTVFGESAIIRQLTVGDLVGPGGTVDTNLSLFLLLETMPLTTLTSILAVLVIGLFFITSSDSGSLVIDMLAHGGSTNTPRLTRIYWSLLEGVAAGVLLIAGGSAALIALQTASILTAVPISIIMAVACISLLRAFRYELAMRTDFVRIVGGPEEVSQPAPEEDEADSSGSDAAAEDTELVVAITDLRPGVVDLHRTTGKLTFTDDPTPIDPLKHEVFDTPEYAESAEGAAKLAEAEDAEKLAKSERP
ncbi:MAG: BCCT family transporter [Actinomycetia bacterium]|nr:BCCT family transporter [Actinomycetes bacterium]